MLLDNLQNSPDVDDCSGSIHTLLLETSVTPIVDQPTENTTNPAATFSSSTPSKRSPPRRQYSSESNDSSPEKVSHKQRSSAYPYHHHPQLNTTYTISPDISTSSLISASEHYNGESLLMDNICSPQTSNSSPDTPEWSLIDSFHKYGKNGDKLQNGNDSPSKRPLLANQEKDEYEDDYDEPYQDLKDIDSEDSINNRGNKVIITIGNKSSSPVASDSTLDSTDTTNLDLKTRHLHNQNEFQRQPSWTPLPSSTEALIGTNRETSPKKQSPKSSPLPFQQNGIQEEEEDINYAYATPYSPNQEHKNVRNHPYVPPPIFASPTHTTSAGDHGVHLNRHVGIEGSPSSISSSEESESDLESIHSYHPPAKVIDIPSAKRLATRLFHLDGFKKTDVSRHLSRNNEYNQGEY